MIVRNILITCMMLIVVALLFTSIVTNDTNGLKKNIADKGTTANNRISGLSTN
jgi:cytochrome oxidase Cu insertion factor (SCO1/SenC/PrrC family)